MSKKNSKAKNARLQRARSARKAQDKASMVSRTLSVIIMGSLGWFVYQDVIAEPLQGVQSRYESTEYLNELHEIDVVLEELQATYPYTTEPMTIKVCWPASQQRLVPAYMADQECN